MLQIHSPRPLYPDSIIVLHRKYQAHVFFQTLASAHTSLSLNNLDCSAMTGCQRNFAITAYQRGIEQFG